VPRRHSCGKVNPEIVITGWSRALCRPVDTFPRLRAALHLPSGGVRARLCEGISGARRGRHELGRPAHGASRNKPLLLALAAMRNQGGWQAIVAAEEGGSHIERLRTRTLIGRGRHPRLRSVARALVPLLQAFGPRSTPISTGVPPELMIAAGV